MIKMEKKKFLRKPELTRFFKREFTTQKFDTFLFGKVNYENYFYTNVFLP